MTFPSLRSVGAVAAGYLVFAVPAAALFPLSHVDPHRPQRAAFMALILAYGGVLALAAGYLAALLAGRRPVAHARAVSIIIAVLALASLMARAGGGAIWTQVATLLLFAPLALAGGWLRGIHVARRETRGQSRQRQP